jgi:ABC-type glycerol-3-phosphate transport system substrate-binding protein
MLHMRPFQIILIAVFAVLGLIGLYVFSTFSGFGNNAAQIGTVVVWGTLPAKAVNSGIEALKIAHKEYAGVSYVEKPVASFDTDLANALASGQGPDLVIIDQEELVAEAPKIQQIPFKSIPQRTFLDTFVSEDELYLTSTGTYGIPIVIDPLVLYYNRALLSGAGIASPPTTWEAVIGLTPSVTKQNGNQTVSVAAVPFGGYGNVTNARAILSLLLLQAGSPITQTNNQGLRSVLGDTSASTDTTGNTPAEAALNFYTQFANPSRTVYSWNPSLPVSRQAFTSGDLALYPGFASEEAGLAAANPNLDFDMAVIPQPGSGGMNATYGLAYTFVFPKVAKNMAGAYSTALSLTASDILPNLAEALGMAPAKRSLLVSDPTNRYTSVYYPQALTAKGWLSPLPSVVDGVFSAMISSMTTGRSDVKQALSDADLSLNAAFSQ